MAELMLLEYKDGQFHHNMVRDRRPQWEPNTNGWETIALTDEDKAGVFGNIMECKLHRREAGEGGTRHKVTHGRRGGFQADGHRPHLHR